MIGLTAKQSALFDFISAHVAEHDIAPDFDTMAKAVGLNSKSGIARLVDGLEERGFIRRIRNQARSLTIISKNEREGVLAIFPTDIRVWIERRAALDGVTPQTIIKERMRELAESEGYAELKSA